MKRFINSMLKFISLDEKSPHFISSFTYLLPYSHISLNPIFNLSWISTFSFSFSSPYTKEFFRWSLWERVKTEILRQLKQVQEFFILCQFIYFDGNQFKDNFLQSWNHSIIRSFLISKENNVRHLYRLLERGKVHKMVHH